VDTTKPRRQAFGHIFSIQAAPLPDGSHDLSIDLDKRTLER